MTRKKPHADEPEIHNRKARHNYEILDTLECGIVLLGSEVKSVRAGRVSLGEGYVRAQEHPLTLDLHAVRIDLYANAGAVNRSPDSVRKLLAHKREIRKLAKASDVKGMTIVPLKMYFKEGRIKVLIGLGRGKRSHDKRQSIKEREQKREIDRAMSKRV
ncbi:MAG: SsrA-binding protein SmpB [Phycisphaerales bacterium]